MSFRRMLADAEPEVAARAAIKLARARLALDTTPPEMRAKSEALIALGVEELAQRLRTARIPSAHVDTERPVETQPILAITDPAATPDRPVIVRMGEQVFVEDLIHEARSETEHADPDVNDDVVIAVGDGQTYIIRQDELFIAVGGTEPAPTSFTLDSFQGDRHAYFEGMSLNIPLLMEAVREAFSHSDADGTIVIPVSGIGSANQIKVDVKKSATHD